MAEVHEVKSAVSKQSASQDINERDVAVSFDVDLTDAPSDSDSTEVVTENRCSGNNVCY